MSKQQTIIKKYVTENKTKQEICEEMGINVNDLNAWIQGMSLKALKLARSGYFTNSWKSSDISRMQLYRSKYGI